MRAPLAVLAAVLILLAAGAAAALVAPAARAGSRPLTIMQDDALLLRSGPAVRDATLDDMRALGVRVVRVLAVWRDFARGPAAWTQLDGLQAAARARGLRLLLTPTGPGPGSVSRRPSRRAFGAFVAALGRRYPEQRLWSVWNEPNAATWLRPQRVRRRGGRVVPVSPRIYRGLLRAAGRALAATGHRGDELLIGETAPVGRRTGPPAQRSVGPAAFAARLLRGHGRRLPGTGWAFHPYSLIGHNAACRSGAARIPVLRRRLDRAARRGVIRRRMPVWLTEAGFQTDPPDRLVGVSPRAQARAIDRLAWLAARARRVRSVAQYLLVDEQQLGGFQTGLRYANGAPKPSYAAYRMPLWLERRGAHRAVLWGQVRPARGGPQRVVVEHRRRAHARWRAAFAVHTRGRGAFLRRRVHDARGQWRLRWTAPDGTVLRSRAARAVSACGAARRRRAGR